MALRPVNMLMRKYGAPYSQMADVDATSAALTENTGAIGGTNDGDLTAFVANLTENSGAIGGTNDGNLPALVDPSGDAGATVIAGIRECAAKINAINTATTAQIRELAAMVNKLTVDVAAILTSAKNAGAMED